jgi:histidinol-phosphate aminotransferase
MAKLANNENPYGPPESVMKAMTQAFKYANRYGYPDGGIVAEIAKHHGVKTENVMIAAGSGEILDVVGTTFLQGGKKVVGVEPSYTSVYQHATSIRADAIRIPLLENYTQDIPAIIKATRTHYRDVGFVYLCNPNNPTARIVTSREVKQLLDGIPEDMPVLIDEAYHHFVDDPSYSTSIPYVLEGRPVIVARTFSKIAALAGMRLGYAVAPRELLRQMRPFSTGTVNALVKWGGVAALRDTESQAQVKRITIDLRNKATTELEAMGYPVIPSQTNFFMVAIRREVQPVIAEFRKKGVLVGRPFPPMTQHLRVSVGTADEMRRFMSAFKEIFPAPVGSRNG